MLIEKIHLAGRVGYLRLFGPRSDIRSDYEAAAETYDAYYSRNLIRASQPYIDNVPLPVGAQVLDLACGTGFFTHILAERIGPSGKVMAADISEGMLKRNQEGAARKDLGNIEFITGDAIDLLRKQPNASVELINIGWGICYMDQKALNSEVLRVLKPDGYLSIIENKASTLHEVSKHFERVLLKHPRSLRKHMHISLPRNSAFLKKTFAKDARMFVVECYDGQVEVSCSNGTEIAEYMVRSGASSGFLDALEPCQVDAVMETFIRDADKRAGQGKCLPKVVHEFSVLIAKKT